MERITAHHYIESAVKIKYRYPLTTEPLRQFVMAQEYYSSCPCAHSFARLANAAKAVVNDCSVIYP